MMKAVYPTHNLEDLGGCVVQVERLHNGQVEDLVSKKHEDVDEQEYKDAVASLLRVGQVAGIVGGDAGASGRWAPLPVVVVLCPTHVHDTCRLFVGSFGCSQAGQWSKILMQATRSDGSRDDPWPRQALCACSPHRGLLEVFLCAARPSVWALVDVFWWCLTTPLVPTHTTPWQRRSTTAASLFFCHEWRCSQNLAHRSYDMRSHALSTTASTPPVADPYIALLHITLHGQHSNGPSNNTCCHAPYGAHSVCCSPLPSCLQLAPAQQAQQHPLTAPPVPAGLSKTS